jgi:hypothetical protein
VHEHTPGLLLFVVEDEGGRAPKLKPARVGGGLTISIHLRVMNGPQVNGR